MPKRIALANIVVGKDNEQQTVNPGEEFETSEYSMSEEDVKRYDETGVTREPDAQPRASRQTGPTDRSELTPMEESELLLVTEGRSPVERDENAERRDGVVERRTPAQSERRETAAGQTERRETAAAPADRNRTARREHDL